jgi:hypothetical protein
MATDLRGAFGLEFSEQIAFFRRKARLLSQDWETLADGTPFKEAMHDQGFIVAGAMEADLLNDLHAAVDKAIDKGTGLEAFRKDFRRIVAERGWHGWTGEGTVAGEAWRTRIIWQTNLSTSYAAGRHAQLTDPELLARRPYWRAFCKTLPQAVAEFWSRTLEARFPVFHVFDGMSQGYFML